LVTVTLQCRSVKLCTGSIRYLKDCRCNSTIEEVSLGIFSCFDCTVPVWNDRVCNHSESYSPYDTLP
ncbi:hypothetical protein K0M31_013548, partial [Melipona bicolor]